MTQSHSTSIKSSITNKAAGGAEPATAISSLCIGLEKARRSPLTFSSLAYLWPPKQHKSSAVYPYPCCFVLKTVLPYSNCITFISGIDVLHIEVALESMEADIIFVAELKLKIIFNIYTGSTVYFYKITTYDQNESIPVEKSTV